MEVHQIKIEDLKPALYNPRKWTDDQTAQLRDSIEKFGFVDPIIVNIAPARRNIVIGGHFRLYVAKEMGMTEVPVVYVDIPDEAREKELNLRLNKNAGAFDYKMLGENFDEELMLAIGFSSDEIDRAFDLKTQEDDQEDSSPNEEPIVKSGDIYKLGAHRLMCGNSTDPVDVGLLMDGSKANLIFTDPPYMVDYKSVKSGNTYSSEKYGGAGNKIFNDNLDDEHAFIFFSEVLKNLYEFSEDNCPIYWWYAGKNSLINQMAWESSDWYMSQIVIWLKNSMVYSMGQDFHRCYEPCMFGWKKKKKHFINKQFANAKDVWQQMESEEFEDQLDVWYQHRDSINDVVHPTQKPVQLAERALRKSSRQGDIVLDLFGGSGSTLIACEQMHRRAFLMELDPKFCDAIIKRFELLTGEKAEKVN